MIDGVGAAEAGVGRPGVRAVRPGVLAPLPRFAVFIGVCAVAGVEAEALGNTTR